MFFFLRHVSVLKMLGFLWRNQMRVKNAKKNSTPPPWPDLQVGPWLGAHSSVTCHSSLGGGGRGGWGGGGLYSTPVLTQRNPPK